jgi:putative LPXTG-motif protein cell wall anchor domain protein
MTPGTRVPGGETPAPNEEPSAPEPAAPGTGTSVTTRGEVTKGNSPAPVSARTGIRNTNAPADTSAPMLANTGSSATIAAGAGVIALAGGVTLVIARKRH